jgi:hypothetical protein
MLTTSWRHTVVEHFEIRCDQVGDDPCLVRNGDVELDDVDTGAKLRPLLPGSGCGKAAAATR